MRAAEQGLSEGLHLARVLLNLKPEHIGEQVAARISQELPVLIKFRAAALSVAIEFGLKSDQMVEVVNHAAAAAEDVETGDAGSIGVELTNEKPMGTSNLG